MTDIENSPKPSSQPSSSAHTPEPQADSGGAGGAGGGGKHGGKLEKKITDAGKAASGGSASAVRAALLGALKLRV